MNHSNPEDELPMVFVNLLSKSKPLVLNALEYLENLDIFQEDISKLLKHHSCVNRLLTSLANWQDEEEILDRTSHLVANLSGETARGTKVKKWKFKEKVFQIRELSFVECDLGWQTWSSGILLTQLIDTEKIIVENKEILELGCGTGLCG